MERSGQPRQAFGPGEETGAGPDASSASDGSALLGLSPDREPALRDAALRDPALRDAAAILERATADETAADEARERYRTQAMVPIEPEGRVARLLVAGEQVFAVRCLATLERRQDAPMTVTASGLAGDLYVTSQRLLLVGRHVLWIELDEIADVLLAGERLLLVLRGGRGVAIAVDRPRLLRVEIAAARAQAAPTGLPPARDTRVNSS